jgi:hypothetical protein
VTKISDAGVDTALWDSRERGMSPGRKLASSGPVPDCKKFHKSPAPMKELGTMMTIARTAFQCLAKNPLVLLARLEIDGHLKPIRVDVAAMGMKVLRDAATLSFAVCWHG